VEGCKKYLRKSLQVNPALKESRMFWAFLKSEGHVNKDDGSPAGDAGESKSAKSKERSDEANGKAGPGKSKTSAPVSLKMD
jgi:hypothetical protein